MKKRAAQLERQATVEGILARATDTEQSQQQSATRAATATSPERVQPKLERAAIRVLPPLPRDGSRSPPPSPLASIPPLKPIALQKYIPQPRLSPSESVDRRSLARVPSAATMSHERLRSLLVTPTERKRRQESAERGGFMVGLNLSPPPQLPSFSRAGPTGRSTQPLHNTKWGAREATDRTRRVARGSPPPRR